MKSTLIVFLTLLVNLIFAQVASIKPTPNCKSYTIVPLRTYTDIPEDQCYYMKDTDNELPDYEGTWKGTWNDKTLLITFTKLTDKYDTHFKYYKDFLIAKFKVLDYSGNILFDNTSLSDDNVKIKGGKFAKIGAKSGPNNDIGGKYSLLYSDSSLCGIWGTIYINFADTAKTKLELRFSQKTIIIFPDCYYYDYPSAQHPKPLPNETIILTKQ